MLVAKDSITRLKPLVGSGHSVSSSAGTAPWRTIRAPINSSKPKAIHGPQVSAQIRTYLPDNQPTSGIINWKRPKWNDRRKICLGAQHVAPTPRPTAKASKPRATEIMAISNILNVNGSPCKIGSQVSFHMLLLIQFNYISHDKGLSGNGLCACHFQLDVDILNI